MEYPLCSKRRRVSSNGARESSQLHDPGSQKRTASSLQGFFDHEFNVTYRICKTTRAVLYKRSKAILVGSPRRILAKRPASDASLCR
jgi:hypothetical protein